MSYCLVRSRPGESKLCKRVRIELPFPGSSPPLPFARMDIPYNFHISYIWILVAAFLTYYSIKDRHRLPLPPGPDSLPIIGNVFDLPSSHEYLKYAEWGKKHGDVTHVTAMGKHIIILNSIKACIELLEERSAIYSDRPTIPMITEPTL